MNTYSGNTMHKYFKVGDKVLIKNVNYLQGAVISKCRHNIIECDIAVKNNIINIGLVFDDKEYTQKEMFDIIEPVDRERYNLLFERGLKFSTMKNKCYSYTGPIFDNNGNRLLNATNSKMSVNSSYNIPNITLMKILRMINVSIGYGRMVQTNVGYEFYFILCPLTIGYEYHNDNHFIILYDNITKVVFDENLWTELVLDDKYKKFLLSTITNKTDFRRLIILYGKAGKLSTIKALSEKCHMPYIHSIISKNRDLSNIQFPYNNTILVLNILDGEIEDVDYLLDFLNHYNGSVFIITKDIEKLNSEITNMALLKIQYKEPVRADLSTIWLNMLTRINCDNVGEIVEYLDTRFNILNTGHEIENCIARAKILAADQLVTKHHIIEAFNLN